MRPALWIALGLAAAAPAFAGNNYASERSAVTLSPAQTQFVLRCGGCHGTLGISPPKSVPSLRGVAGWFLCTPEGREYVIRLPNVARAQFDDATLAQVMNFVTFDLGEQSAPKGALRFTTTEVAAIRARPLNAIPLNEFRQKVVSGLVKRCHAPPSMLEYGRVS